MSRDEFTGKVFMSYCGDRNASHEIIAEYDRLNNIINRIDSFVDRTIEVIKQQPSGNDEWILERLNGIKYLIELKENK